MHVRPRLGPAMTMAQEVDRLRRTIALLERQDSAGQTAVWFGMGIRPKHFLTGSIDRRILLAVAKQTQAYLEKVL